MAPLTDLLEFFTKMGFVLSESFNGCYHSKCFISLFFFFPAAILSDVNIYKLTQCPEMVFRDCKMPHYIVTV